MEINLVARILERFSKDSKTILWQFPYDFKTILICWTEECLEVTSVPLLLGSHVAQCKNKGLSVVLVLGHECPNASPSRITSVLRRAVSLRNPCSGELPLRLDPGRGIRLWQNCRDLRCR
ncbi:hypothetical protein K0M31_001843 [Melipona bicolor]|uniref:Uncharacterized protein n=1 Tax=Melipona bicolor TaxID=60889 RepID=A0AA40KY99_9HYME|nr:hypothetical protein K0M31_001843 [Melipona bicolor]